MFSTPFFAKVKREMVISLHQYNSRANLIKTDSFKYLSMLFYKHIFMSRFFKSCLSENRRTLRHQTDRRTLPRILWAWRVTWARLMSSVRCVWLRASRVSFAVRDVYAAKRRRCWRYFESQTFKVKRSEPAAAVLRFLSFILQRASTLRSAASADSA